MTLKTVINGVCDSLSIDRFQTIYGNPDAQTMLRIAKLAGDEISRRVDWRSMLKQATLSSTPASIPNDYHRAVPGGGVLTAGGVFARPTSSSTEWAVIKAVASSQPYFFLDTAMISISPVSAGANATLLYVSKNWIKNGSSEKDEFGSDDDVMLFPERLLEKDIIWRYRRENGFSYDDQLAEFEADLAQEARADRGLS